MQNVNRVGVMIPEGQLAQDRAEPNTLLAILPPGKMVPIRYADEHGRVHQAVVFEAGGEYYMPPGAEKWASELRPVRDWMKKAILAMLPGDGALDAPKEDTVDVVADGTA